MVLPTALTDFVNGLLSIIGSRVGASATSLSRSAGRSPNAHRIFLFFRGLVTAIAGSLPLWAGLLFIMEKML
jgi:hypothetical protein